MNSERPTIPAPRPRPDVRRLWRLSAAIARLADALNDQTPTEITARFVSCLTDEIEHFVTRLAAALGLRWAGGERQSGEGDAEQGAGAHGPSVERAAAARGCAS